MKYLKKITGIICILAVIAATLCGCGKTPGADEIVDRQCNYCGYLYTGDDLCPRCGHSASEEVERGMLVSLSFSCNSMDYDYSYNFFLRYDGVTAFFDADFLPRIQDSEAFAERLQLEGLMVTDDSVFEELEVLLEKYDIYELAKNGGSEDSNEGYEVMDETIRSLSCIWGTEEYSTAQVEDIETELFEYLAALAVKLSGENAEQASVPEESLACENEPATPPAESTTASESEPESTMTSASEAVTGS